MAVDLRELPFVEEGRLPEADESALESVVRHYLNLALADENKPEERARRWRKYVSLERYDQVPYPGAPNVTTPLIRQKVDGIKAHIFASIDQRPMFVVTPYNEIAQRAAPYLEQLMSVVIERTGARTEILKAIRDAIEVGTGHVKHVMLKDADGRMMPATRYVPFEHIYVYPSTSVKPEHVNYFERYYEPRYAILEHAEAGIYWHDRVDLLLEGSDDVDMNKEEELWEVWIRFRGDIYEVRYSQKAGILSYRKSSWAEMLGRAPYDPIYIEPSQLSYWGDSVAQILESLQEVSDAAFNMELARGQFVMNPPILVSTASPAYKHLAERGMWEPGEVIGASADPSRDIHIPFQSINPFDMQLLQIANKMAEEATISDLLIPGQAVGGRKTATEVNLMTSVGALKLRNYLSSVADTLRRHAQAKWKLVSIYILKNPNTDTSAIEWDVNGRETVPEQQNRLSQIQYLLNPNFLQLIQVAQANPFLQQVLIAFMSYLDLPGLGAMFRRLMNGQGMQVSGAQVPVGAQGILGAGAPSNVAIQAGGGGGTPLE